MNKLILCVISFLLLVSCKQNIESQNKQGNKEAISFEFKHELRNPKTPSKNPPLLLLLHGLGSNEKDLFSFAEYLDPRLLVVSPRAPIVLGDNSYSWFALNRGQSGWTYDINDVKKSSEQVLTYIDQLVKQYDVDPEQIFIGGFSQGAIMSLTTGLNHTNKIKGIVCLSGRLYPELKPELSKINDYNNIQLFISHGQQDQVLPYADIVSDVNYLKELGLNPMVKYYNAQHTISQDNFRDMVDWISSKLD